MTQRTSAQAQADPPSGFRQLLGYRVLEWKDGEAAVTLTIGPRHLNRAGALHGGVISTLIDAAGGYAGCYCAVPGHVRRCVTVSLTTQFLAQTKTGVLTARARVRGGGKRLFMASTEVHDATGALLAIGEGVYRYRSGSESPQGVPVGRHGEKRDTPLG
ncbi:MAG TPA: PaaI family thioesterase [Alphaproteobacteria bacterium]|nr:PaaI family thioesterase [Alphaproteobacteria bacterium]